MAKTLVIKNANFSVNKLDTVRLIEVVPCTSVVLNKSTATIKLGEVETLTAVVAPIDTTDVVLWESSDESIATVDNGAISVIGLGTSMITATCGSQSATCIVSTYANMDTSNAFYMVGYRVASSPLSEGQNGLGYIDTSEIRGAIGSTTGTYPFGHRKVESATPYSYKLPNNTTHIRVTVPSTVDVYRIAWNNDETTVEYQGNNYCAQVGVTDSFTTEDNVMQMAIPSYSGYPTVNSFVISFVSRNGNKTFTEEMLKGVTVEFLHIEE